MIPLLLILIPLISGLASLIIKAEKGAKNWAILSSIVTLAVAVYATTLANNAPQLSFNSDWLPTMGASISLSMDGMSKKLCLLAAVAMPLIFIGTYKNSYKRPGSFYALMLLTQAGMLGVFLATDLLLFYFFWDNHLLLRNYNQ